MVIEGVVLNVQACRLFFGEVRLLHNLFSRFKVRKEYSGTSISLLIETRWSGYLYAVQSIRRNYDEILRVLKRIKDGNGNDFEPVDIALAAGIFYAIIKESFIFMLHFLNDLLSTIEPANQILQKRDIGFRNAIPIIEAVIESIERLRSDECFEQFVNNTHERKIQGQGELENALRV